MKLTWVISSLCAGGAEGVMTALTNGLAGRGHEVTVLTLDDGFTPPALPLSKKIVHRPLGLAGWSTGPVQAVRSNLNRISALRRAVETTIPDVVVSFMDTTNILCLLAVGRDRPVVVSERVNPARYHISPVWAALRRMSYRRAASVVIQTSDVARRLPIALRNRCVTIPNPISPCRPGMPSTEINCPAIAAMGRFEPQKGFDLLLHAFSLVAEKFPKWKLVLFGRGTERPRLETLRDELRLQDRVLFPGFSATPHADLAQAEVFALSSRFEGFPNALCEAMACGLAVVATDCPSGPSAIIHDGENGLLVPSENVEALAESLTRLMADSKLRNRLGIRASEVVERFGMEKILDMWEDLLRRVASGTIGA